NNGEGLLVQVDGFWIALLRHLDLCQSGQSSIVVRICGKSSAVLPLRLPGVAKGKVFIAQLPLGPGDVLLWTSLRLPQLNRLLESFDGTSGIAPQTLQTRQAAVGIQISLEVEHPLKGLLRLAIFPHFQMRIAEDAIGMTIGRIEFDCLGGLLGCPREVVPG